MLPLLSEHRIEMMEAALATIQASLKATNVFAALTEEVYYNEALPKKHERQIFTKLSSKSDPWDHIAIFEIKLCIASNNKSKV